MNRNLVFASILSLVGAYIFWQVSHEMSTSTSPRRALSKMMQKLDNKQASADDTVPLTIEAPNLNSISERYQFYRGCLESKDPCEGFNIENENVYMSDVRAHMLKELGTYSDALKQQPNSLTEDDQTLARELTTDATPDVQVIGLEILRIAPPSEANLEALTEVLKSGFDDGVIQVGGDVLLKYRGASEYQDMITKAFLEQIGLGVNDLAALAAIAKLPPFLSSANVAQFRTLRDELKAMSQKERLQTRRYKALDQVLSQYKN